MKRAAIIISALVFAAAAANVVPAASEQKEKPRIVTTIFPEYDWVREVMGDRFEEAEVSFLMDNGVDLHSFQPTVQDMVAISSCDLFVYVGGESDAWVKDALAGSKNSSMVVLNLMEILSDEVREEEIVEGMQVSDWEDDDDDHDDDDNHDSQHCHSPEETEYDEHIWLSLRNAMIIVDELADALDEIDPANEDLYEANAEAYCEKLRALDQSYAKAVKEGSRNTLLFADRFPFRYMIEDYGLEYYAAFSGCSTEIEASFETVAFLAEKVNELGLKVLLTIKGDDQNIAGTVRSATTAKDQEILTLDSMQNTNSEDVKNNVTYLGIMEENLEILKKALE